MNAHSQAASKRWRGPHRASQINAGEGKTAKGGRTVERRTAKEISGRLEAQGHRVMASNCSSPRSFLGASLGMIFVSGELKKPLVTVSLYGVTPLTGFRQPRAYEQ
uniref:Uncharacterized protein n=1 Tax=Chromera velia CCMP2878 TaxID=1169474 RepID=A0A0G4F9Z3_9ALVE|eukprot:Cvel_15940.t1-p1 / transcript=Cvel_15940.t1 / gene=Cvel_15940 / organism=Chromera_velia_CCMP2878 / gene_product=hypothetical protein / transcript_product=hypothetical protein / location=Cvel_scaffold1206:9772-12519(+) / protein_length=105 / sequence_SO=supercontig / SO=protein_coding / is_pseudo=false